MFVRQISRQRWSQPYRIGLGTTLVGLALVACEPPTSSSSSQPESELRAEAARLNQMAGALSAALDDTRHRRSLLDILRNSPFVEHKLTLTEFLAHSGSTDIVDAMQGRLRGSDADLASAAARLPALDFYVPSRSQRRSWTGQGSLAVAYVPDVDDPDAGITLFWSHGPSKKMRTRDLADPSKLADVVLVLHGSEPRPTRIGRQAGRTRLGDSGRR